jgi:putative FmdB family regulatory protein
MAIFDVKCHACGEVSEVLLKIDQEPDTCPKCNAVGHMEKLLGGGSLNFYFTNGAGCFSGGTFNNIKLAGKDI